MARHNRYPPLSESRAPAEPCGTLGASRRSRRWLSSLLRRLPRGRPPRRECARSCPSNCSFAYLLRSKSLRIAFNGTKRDGQDPVWIIRSSVRLFFSSKLTSRGVIDTSVRGQGTKSLRSSPLRGSKSRDAGRQLRG